MEKASSAVVVFLAIFLFAAAGGAAEEAMEETPAFRTERSVLDRRLEMKKRVERLKQRSAATAGEGTDQGSGRADARGADGGETVPPEKMRYHLVQTGENPYQIAVRYGISIDDLYRFNNLVEGQSVQPGQRLAVGPPGPERAGPEKERYITMNFRDVDLDVLIKFMSELVGKNFLVDPNVKGRVTILSPEPVTVNEAYRVFLSVLEVNGFTAVPSGKVIKVITAADARSRGVETYRTRRELTGVDKVITQLVHLKHGDAGDFSKLLRPLIAKTGLLIPYEETNTLIIIDAQSNIERLVSIIDELDIPSAGAQISLFGLENASAEKLASQLSELFQPAKGRRAAVEFAKLIPDERSNSLIILASSKTTAEIRSLLEKLDRKVVQRREGIHTYNLQYAVAEDVAAVLGEIPGKGAEKKEGKAKAPLVSKDVQISSDKATNTLVIIAEPDEYRILENIIKKLDVPRIMVHVEALIMEVSVTRAMALGVEWRIGDRFKGGLGDGSGGVWLGGSSSGAGLNALEAGKLPAGFSAGVIGRAITLGDRIFPTIGAFVQAVQTDSDFNVISTPQILTLDNEEAVIEVGQSIPFVTRIDQGTEITSRAIQSFEYRDVGVTLKVKPQINNNRFVRLNVEQSVKSVLETTAGEGLLAPTTTFRTTKSAITVRDGETAVIGGLIQSQMERGKTQTPCLGGLPFLGWAFKDVSDRDTKTNLMVFLTPHIIENPEEGRALYGEKKDYMDKEVKRSSKEKLPEILRERTSE